MRISKIHIPEDITKSKNLGEINLTKKPLGSTVALVGKNGAGKSRVLFFENYIQTINPLDFINGHIDYLPNAISTKFEQNFTAAKTSLKKYENTSLTETQKAHIKAQATQQIQPVANALKKQGNAYIKLVDNDALKNIKTNVGNAKNFTFEQILNNQHSQNLLNEFTEFNSQSTIQYFTKLTNEIVTDEFNLYIKNRNTPELIVKEIQKKDSFKLFKIFQGYVKNFLGSEFSYQQKPQGNTLSSTLFYNEQPFDVNLFSPGQKTLFAYAILFFYLDVNFKTNIRESIIIIDEPEKHLHPEAQITLINALKSIISKSGQLWIATHSVHILSHLEYDEIMMIKDNIIVPPSRITPGKSFNELMGIDDHISKLITFISSISEWAYGNFMAQCFKEPDVIFGNDPEDPQFILFKQFLSNKTKIELLDFGAGKGRIGYTLSEDEVVAEKSSYSAFEPDKGNYEVLNNVPNIKKTYSNSDEIPDKAFDCVLLCNVLHEINPKEWRSSLETIKRILKDNGYLLIIEDKFLPKGENAHQFGYLILGTDETKTLLNSKEILELKLQEDKFKERILFNAFRKEDINPDEKSTKKAIQLLNKNSFVNIKTLRKMKKDINQGRNYANQTQLYINSQLALESL